MYFSSYKKDIRLKKNNEYTLYNNILSLSRNRLFYTKFLLSDTFQNRINLIFFHISFIFIKIKQTKKKVDVKKFDQNLFDLIFNQIELNMRELGLGDVTVNKKMKFLVKSFYSILLFCEDYSKKSREYKISFFNQYLKSNFMENTANNKFLIIYFNDFKTFCSDLSLNSVLKGDLKFEFN